MGLGIDTSKEAATCKERKEGIKGELTSSCDLTHDERDERQ